MFELQRGWARRSLFAFFCITTLDNNMFRGAVYATNVSTRDVATEYRKRVVDLVLTHSQEVYE